MVLTDEQIRQFEEWARTEGLNLETIQHGFKQNYTHLATAHAWHGFKAAISLQGEAVPEGRLIGYTSQYDLDFPFAYANLGPENSDRNIPVYAYSPPTTAQQSELIRKCAEIVSLTSEESSCQIAAKKILALLPEGK